MFEERKRKNREEYERHLEKEYEKSEEHLKTIRRRYEERTCPINKGGCLTKECTFWRERQVELPSIDRRRAVVYSTAYCALEEDRW